MSTSQTRDRLAAMLEEPMTALGLDIEAVELSDAGKRRVLAIALDRDGGLSMDDVADATREISTLLDDSDVMGKQPYTLEVSSPGRRPPADAASTLAPQHRAPGQGDPDLEGEPFTGRIESADEHGAVLEDGTQVRFDAVKKARIEIEFKQRES